jgi:putative NADH-flavin reductase
MANLLVLGGSGPTGSLIVTQALAEGHSVTALSRHPEQLRVTHARLKTLTGDVTEDNVIARALAGHDAVLSALGRGQRLTSNHLMTRTVAKLLPAMAQTGPKRLIHLSAFGAGVGKNYASALQRILYETFLRSLAADKAVADAEVSRSALQWTIVAPVTFAVGSRVGRYRVGEEIRVSGLPRISRASVADFMLKCLQDPSTIRKRLAMVPE